MAKSFDGDTIDEVDLTTCDKNSVQRLEAAYASHSSVSRRTARPLVLGFGVQAISYEEMLEVAKKWRWFITAGPHTRNRPKKSASREHSERVDRFC